MTDWKKIMVYLPNNLISEVDEMLDNEVKSRSDFIVEAMKLYISQKKVQIRKKMCQGYREMALINLSLAQEAAHSEEEAQIVFEQSFGG